MTNSEQTDIFLISEEEEGERLDKILSNRFPAYSRTYFQYLIDDHLVLLNGEPVKKRIKPQAGDEIEIEFALTPEISLQAEPIPLEILYEDDFILAVNKPAGMVVHPAVGNWNGTFVNALLYHCQNLPRNDADLRPGIVHRLDKDTTGVLVAAKTAQAQQGLVERFASRQVYKEYLGICIGNPGEGEVNAPIGRHPVNRKQMAVQTKGRSAQTFFKTLHWNDKLSLVKMIIATGRTHQIRVHMKHRGTPILGDELYGQPQTNKKYHVERQFLHAYIVRFTHPISNEEIEIKAPLPKDMGDFIEKLHFKLSN